MAARTPTVSTGSLGSFRLIIARFTELDDADTWVSGLEDEAVKAYWTQDRDNPGTQGDVGVAVVYSAGTFTFYPAEDNKLADLFIIIGA